MKKLLPFLFLALTSVCKADSKTPRLGLTIPTIGSPTWGQKINGNFQILDATVAINGQAGTGTITQINAGTNVTVTNSTGPIVTISATGGGSSITGNSADIVYLTNSTGTAKGDNGFQYDNSVSSVTISGDLLTGTTFYIKNSSVTFTQFSGWSSKKGLNLRTTGFHNFYFGEDSSGEAAFSNATNLPSAPLDIRTLSAFNNVIANFRTNNSTLQYLYSLNSGLAMSQVIQTPDSGNTIWWQLFTKPLTTNIEFARFESSATVGAIFKLFGAGNSANYVGFKAPDAPASSVVWELPGSDGTNGQVLTTNGAKVLSWQTVSSGGGGGSSSLAVATNTAGGFRTLISSPTGVLSFLDTQFSGTTSGTTAFITLNPSSVTLLGAFFARNLNIVGGSTSSPTVVFQSTTSQTADILEIKTSTGAVVSSITANGKLFTQDLQTSTFTLTNGVNGFELYTDSSGVVVQDSVSGLFYNKSLHRFSINEAGGSPGGVFEINHNSAQTTRAININNTGTSASDIYVNSGTTQLQVGGAQGGCYYKVVTQDPLFFDTSNRERIYMTATGRTWIGDAATGATQTPDAQLQVMSMAASTVTASFVGASGQTSNLTNWENSSNVVVSSVDFGGGHFVSTLTITSPTGGIVFGDGTRQTTAASGGSVSLSSTQTWTGANTFFSTTAIKGKLQIPDYTLTGGASSNAVPSIYDATTNGIGLNFKSGTTMEFWQRSSAFEYTPLVITPVEIDVETNTFVTGKLTVGQGVTSSTNSLTVYGNITTATDTAHPVPTLTSCGTGSTLSFGATDTSGQITFAGIGTSCQVVFGGTKNKPPACVVNGNLAIANETVATTVSGFTVGSTAALTSEVLSYICLGNE